MVLYLYKVTAKCNFS